MASITFTRHLYRFFPDLPSEPLQVEGETVAAIVDALDARYAGLGHYLRDEAGRARRHVAIYVDDTLVSDRVRLSDPVGPTTSIFVAQALSGG
ncbi:MAG: MoaD/ThiS family protein [Myxococcales bacterium]|nr:MoaD/ThiS family protein [Myxococcales bacterium]MCB9520772.1 MoaD/ThiS family protein [Myxococcales bacterium]MCB9533489.1 MoaD/ThiS family protein [Myxococcales bacterium]